MFFEYSLKTDLQVPDAHALCRDPFHRVPHQSNEHVEQEDVREDDVQDEQDVENLLGLNVVGELQISHPNGELEHFQCGETDVVVCWLLVFRWRTAERSSMHLGVVRVLWRRVVDENDDGCKRKARYVFFFLWRNFVCHVEIMKFLPAENPKRKTL